MSILYISFNLLKTEVFTSRVKYNELFFFSTCIISCKWLKTVQGDIRVSLSFVVLSVQDTLLSPLLRQTSVLTFITSFLRPTRFTYTCSLCTNPLFSFWLILTFIYVDTEGFYKWKRQQKNCLDIISKIRIRVKSLFFWTFCLSNLIKRNMCGTFTPLLMFEFDVLK